VAKLQRSAIDFLISRPPPQVNIFLATLAFVAAAHSIILFIVAVRVSLTLACKNPVHFDMNQHQTISYLIAFLSFVSFKFTAALAAQRRRGQALSVTGRNCRPG
jgi:hypothetical protein